MSHVNYLAFKEKQLLGSKEISSKYRYHYTYRISTPCGKHYVGVRSCDCLPVDDLGHKYFGSPANKGSRELTRNPDNKFKILNIFPTRLLATLSESYYHHNLDVKNHLDFLNGCNANVKGMSSLNYDEVSMKMTKTKSVVQSDGLSIFQRGAIKGAKTKSVVQSDGLSIFQRGAIKCTATISKIKENGLTISQERSMKAVETMSKVQDNGSTIYQQAGLRGAKTKSTIQDSGLTISQIAAQKMVETRSTILDGGLSSYQEGGRKAAATRSRVQGNGLTIGQAAGQKGAKTRAKIQDDGFSIAQRAAAKIGGVNNYQFKGYYVFRDGKYTGRQELGKYLGFSNAYIKCKADNLKQISNLAYTTNKFLQSLGTREEIVGRTWKDIGFGFEPK